MLLFMFIVVYVLFVPNIDKGQNPQYEFANKILKTIVAILEDLMD